jgi:hypothetical protein
MIKNRPMSMQNSFFKCYISIIKDHMLLAFNNFIAQHVFLLFLILVLVLKCLTRLCNKAFRF